MNKDEAIDKIYYSTLSLVSKNGIGRISSKLLATNAKVGEGTIFKYYGSIKNLLDECAKRYDRELMTYCVEYINKGISLMELWDILFDYLLLNPDGADFYFAYVNYYGFDPTETNARAEEFLRVAKELFKEKTNLSDHKILIFWDFFTTQIFYYINKMNSGLLDNTKENRDFIKQFVFGSFNAI